MESVNLENFVDERHDLVCPYCGSDQLTMVYEYDEYCKVTCQRCKRFVYLNKNDLMYAWMDYCRHVINKCKYPPDMAAVLNEELEGVYSPVNFLNIMNKHKDILEAGNTNEPANEVDMVNHPTHYETGKYECIEVMTEAIGREEVKGFCICNAFKYLYRCRRKNGLEDVKKAKWYIDKFIKLCEEDLKNEDN